MVRVSKTVILYNKCSTNRLCHHWYHKPIMSLSRLKVGYLPILVSYTLGQVNAVSKPVISQPQKYLTKAEERKKMRENLMFVKKENEVLLKYPGELEGKQFKLEHNKNCEIYVNDYNAGGFCDDCEDCIIFWGPATSSVFVRDCKNCRFVIICQQLRLRDCHNCEIMLFSQTDPILESSSGIKYYSCNYTYPELKQQMTSAKMSKFFTNIKLLNRCMEQYME